MFLGSWVVVILFGGLLMGFKSAPVNHDPFSGPVVQDKILNALQKYPTGWPPMMAYGHWMEAYQKRDDYYSSLGLHMGLDYGTPDWRVCEIAASYGIDPELALRDAAEKGFMR